MYDGMEIYRALVVSSSMTTGEVLVKIPSILGADPAVAVSYIGRGKTGSTWKVPPIGQQVLVAVEDDRFSNVYMITPDYLTNYSEELSPTKSPTGFPNKPDSSIAFNSGTRTFTISPVSTSFDVWCKGVKYTKTSSESVTIPNSSGLHYIYYLNGVLGTKTTFFDLENEAPVSYIYWNATDQQAYFFADERHGVAMDWATHEYLHRTRGAALATGLGLINYTTVGVGTSNADAQVGIADGTFFDEDLEINITNAVSPAANSWQQRLQTVGYFPVFYRSGAAWKRDASTAFPLKFGTLAQYNLNTAGSWSNVDIASNRFCIYWIVATNNISNTIDSGPVLSVMGQAEYANIGQAEAATWAEMDLAGLPIFEFRLLYKLIFQTNSGYTNAVKSKLVGAYDLRASATVASGVPSVTATDHGALSGLTDDDHTQYALVSGARSFTGSIYAPSLTGGSASVSGNASASSFFGSGANLTGLNAANVSSGVLDPARIPSLSATTITSGTLDQARLPSATSITSLGTLTGLTVSGTTNLQSTVQKNGTGAKLMVFSGQASASASTSISTTSFTAITGASVTLSLVTGDTVIVTGVFDVACGTSGSPFVGALYAAGAALTPNVLFQTSSGATGRATISQSWVYTASSTASTTIDLRAKVNSTGSVYTVWDVHTTLTYLVLR